MTGKKFNMIKRLLLFYFIISGAVVFARVKLPKLISNGMILQRNAEVNIWGWASANEKITIHFIDKEYSTVADNTGNWKILLKDMKAGGPYKMTIKASNEIEITDILVGDVWLCSGQSNMELPMRRVSWNYPDEIKKCNNTQIRQFRVPQSYDFNNTHADFPSGFWKPAVPENIMEFSAVAYFFAKEIYATYKVPVGLINASLGGSPAQAWMSETALKEFPDYYNEMQRFKDNDLIARIKESDNKHSAAWHSQLYQKDKGNKSKAWNSPDLDVSDWNEIKVPGYWTGTELEKINGVVWCRRDFTVDKNMAGKPALLILGRIVDADSVYINDQFVGSTGYQYPPRRYNIPAGLLKEGKNSIVVRVISNQGVGGFVPDKQYEIVCENHSINLQGVWNYKTGAVIEPLASQTFIRWKPGGLYNTMIAPLLNFRIKGAIWYQGESNTGKPLEYADLFSAMIRDWRNNWKQEELPFVFVQLTNFMESKDFPTESNWATLRESQLKTLSLPNTAMAVTIDIGEWNDIHPLNKKDVGYRLALAARETAYGEENIVYSGPLYKSMEIEGNKIVLSFTNTGSGLLFKNGISENQFAIAGADKKFVWAEAKISNNKIIVWNEKIANPVVARYAWADNPANAALYNKEGLPASPFRTDTPEQ